MYLELVQAALQGVLGAREGRQQVAQGVLAAAAGGHYVVEVLLKGRHLLPCQAHALPKPAQVKEIISCKCGFLTDDSLDACVGSGSQMQQCP